MTDVFREVDEEIRRDKSLELWKKHGNTFVVVGILFIAAVGGWRFYQNYAFKERAALGASFELALAEIGAEKGDVAALTALAEKKSGSYPALARFRLASELALKANDDAGRANAVSAFDALAGDATLPADWRDVAKLRAAFVLMDDAPFADIEKRLAPMVSAAGAFRHSAREGIALSAFRNGEYLKSLDALQAIILDADSPAGLRQRAELLLAVVRSGPTTKP